MEITVKKISSAVTNALQDMIKRANLVPAFLSRVVYNKYLQAQKKRWGTDNQGDEFEGGAWKSLKNKKDEDYKKRKYASYPGGGTKLLVRNGALYNSIVDPADTNHEAIFTDTGIHINTLVKYAGYIDEGTEKMEKRPFSLFSESWKQGIMNDFEAYMVKANS